VTGDALYRIPASFWQTALLPVIPDGAVNVLVMLTATQVEGEIMPHELVAVTHMFPLAVPDVTTMLVVPCPEVMAHPVGTVHV
jgi:hypothetical protein